MLEVELRDSERPMRVIFAWDVLSNGTPNYQMIHVTLDCPWAFKVRASMDGTFAKELLSFVRAIEAREGEWQDPQVLKTRDEDFVITCFECWKNEISVEVSLDAAFDDPEWTVQLRFSVTTKKWHEFEISFEQFANRLDHTQS